MQVKIRYFASLREKAGKSQEDLTLPSPMDLNAIYEMLSGRYGFSLSAGEVKYSVNNEYVDGTYALKEHDVLVFIPPVAGG